MIRAALLETVIIFALVLALDWLAYRLYRRWVDRINNNKEE